MKTHGKYVLLLILCLLTSLGDINAYTERNLLQKSVGSQDSLRKILIFDQKWVEYPDYNDRTGWDTFLGKYKDEYIERGEELLDYKWNLIKATDYLEFQRSGSRDVMQTPFGLNNDAISRLVIAELAEGKGRFIDQIINGVFQYCEMTTWSVSAHLNMQSNNKSLPDFREDIIDLQVADLGAFLSWTYYFLNKEFDKVNPVVSVYLKHEIEKRILNRYLQEPSFFWMALNLKPGGMVNNWNIWSNFNVLQCYLLVEDDHERLAQAVWRSLQSVDKFINYNRSDGACEEGPGYWGHAAGKLFDYLELLSTATNAKISLFDEPLIKNMGEYISNSYVGNGWFVNFADASAKTTLDNFLLYSFGKAVNSSDMVDLASVRYKPSQNLMTSSKRQCIDLYRGFRSIKENVNLAQHKAIHKYKKYVTYHETEVCFMANDAGYFFAAKGGNNNESHNHNDVGTFNLYIDSIPFIIDVGVGTYTRQTFDSGRYNNWGMQSNYHNLPVINGNGQQDGSEFKAKNVRFDEKKQTFSVDIAEAYSKDTNVSEWIRSYNLKDDRLVISDKYSLSDIKERNSISFMTWGSVDIKTLGQVVMEVYGKKVVLTYDKNKFIPSVETIELTDPKFTKVWNDKVYRVLLVAKDHSLKGGYNYTISRLN